LLGLGDMVREYDEGSVPGAHDLRIAIAEIAQAPAHALELGAQGLIAAGHDQHQGEVVGRAVPLHAFGVVLSAIAAEADQVGAAKVAAGALELDQRGAGQPWPQPAQDPALITSLVGAPEQQEIGPARAQGKEILAGGLEACGRAFAQALGKALVPQADPTLRPGWMWLHG
jgi:hypothetical protein